MYLTDYGHMVAPYVDLTDEIRDWVEIVDREDRRRRESDDGGSEDSLEADAESDAPPADRVVATANVKPNEKLAVRSELLGEEVRTGDTLEIEVGDESVGVAIERTDPRSDRHRSDSGFRIDEATRVSL